MMNEYRLLKPSEIDVRVGTVTAKGVTLLLYKDARVDMSILDETHGSEFWQRDHKEIKGNMYAGVAVWNKEIKEWIWKWDCGTESMTEKEKGEASDSFKRACVNLGIGRELYTSPFIFIGCETVPKGERGHDLKDRFAFNGCRVSNIAYNDNREIIKVEIVNKDGEIIFPKGKPTSKPKESEKSEGHQDTETLKLKIIGKVEITALEKSLLRTGVRAMQVTEKYKIAKIDDLNFGQWDETMAKLDVMPDKKKLAL